MKLNAKNLEHAVALLVVFTYKQKFYDWLWYNIGEKIWRLSARTHNISEVNRRLNWMKMDNNGEI